ncbi:MAG: 30S ribosomal protein S2 [Candidatus Woesearchaeota archaeon]
MTEENFLIPNEDYLKSGIHIGTKFRTKYMENFIYKTRSDGLSVLNIKQIDSRIKTAAEFLANYEPEDILIVSRRENGWRPLKLFAKATGAKFFAGRYPPGVLTNPELKNFIEAKVMLVTDAGPDKNAIKDAIKVGIPIVALCDTNNQANNLDLVIPCNNKGKKSLGLVFWLLAKIYLEKKGLKNEGQAFEYTLEQFTEE